MAHDVYCRHYRLNVVLMGRAYFMRKSRTVISNLRASYLTIGVARSCQEFVLEEVFLRSQGRNSRPKAEL